ncbi:hypothetical protein TWF694_010814 [Orbilia ellipsospora]|uniref:Sec20 C-terminal domain-containing protein n=1 Tax=Orbilia ellipsospora TaxID=2528407 RepID=A0AAV9X7G8_9PEZI
MSATSSEISERIAVLTNAYQEVTAQIQRLANLTAPGTEEARNELAGMIHQSLKEGDAELETLTLQTSTLNPSTDPQAALKSRIHKLRDELKLARVSYRKSLLHSKRTSALNARKEREALLLSSSATPQLLSPTSPASPSSIDADPSATNTTTNIQEQQQPYTQSPPQTGAQLYRRPYHTPRKDKKDMTQNDLITSASSDVTTALRRTHALMTAELTRSHFAHETLTSSTETLKNLNQNYSAFDNVVQKSRGLITDLVKKNKSDMWYYQMSLYALVGTIGWLIFRRLLWGPVFLLVWLPLRALVWICLMPFRGQVSSELGGMVDDGRDGGGVIGGGGGVRSEVEKVVESMVPVESVVSVEIKTEEGRKVKKVVLDDGQEIQVPLEVPEEIVEEVPEVEVEHEEVEAVHDEL